MELERDFLATDYALVKTADALPRGLRALVVPEPHPIADYENSIVGADSGHFLFFGGFSERTAFVFFEEPLPVAAHHVVLIARMKDDRVVNYCRFLPDAFPSNVAELKELVPDRLQPWGGYECK